MTRSFNTMVPEPPGLVKWLAGAGALLILWGFVCAEDYRDQRRIECTNYSNRNFIVTYDESKDICKKERRNGTTAQNR